MIKRRTFLYGMGGLAFAPSLLDPRAARATSALAPAPLAEPHFPDRLHQFVWRNWELANADRMADVVGCRPEEILSIGSSLGLPPKPELTDDHLRRIYITVIRQNWHLLPDDQLIGLLGWTDERLRFTLKEDDFLDVKLGPKPDCPRLAYAPPGEEARLRAAEIKELVREFMGEDLAIRGEPAFAFVPRLSDLSLAPRRDPSARVSTDEVDLSGWSARGDEGVDPRVVDRLTEYLRDAMEAGMGRDGAPAIRLRLDPRLGPGGEQFRVAVEDGGVEVTGNGAGGLLQGISWLQDRMEERGGPFLPRGVVERQAAFHPRHLYSYFALYGDPLLETDIDPFPDGLLEKLARAGANGIWLQAVLNTLAPSATFPEFGKDGERRLETLAGLVERASRFGIRVFLYLNEPRSMPPEFFEGREAMRGAESGGYFAMCTAHPAVREWIADSLAHVFDRVPGLGGVFSITMSENFTNCYSKGRPDSCPRCSQRENWGEVVSLHARRNRLKDLLPRYGRIHPVLETGIHDIDLMLWYVGRPVRRVRGFARSITGGMHPETFWGVLEFDGGAIGVVETIWLLPKAAGIGLDDAFRVVGTRGVGDLHLTPGALSFWREDGHEVPDVSYDPRVMDSARGALREELAYLCDRVADGRAPELNTGTDGRRAVRVALALIESAAAGADVAIEDWD